MRAFIHYLRVRFAVLPVIDALVLVAAMVLGYQIRLLNEDGLVFSTLRGLVFAALMMLTMTAFGLYSRQQDEPFRLVVQKVFAAYLVTLLGQLALFYVFPESEVGRGVFAIASVLGLVGILVVRYLAFRLGFLQRRGRRVLVMGEGEEADMVLATLADSVHQHAAHLVAQVPVDLKGESLLAVARQHKATHIVVAAHERRGGHIPAVPAYRLAGVWGRFHPGTHPGHHQAPVRRGGGLGAAAAGRTGDAGDGGGDPAGDRKADILPAGAGLRAGAVIRHPEIPLDGAGCREGRSALGQHR